MIFTGRVSYSEKVLQSASLRNLSMRSEEHTSELQSLAYLVCRLLLEKKKHRLANQALDLSATALPADTPAWSSDAPNLLERVQDRLARDIGLTPRQRCVSVPRTIGMPPC